MARNLIPSEATIRGVKPGDPRTRLSDGDGLFLLLAAKVGTSHAWRLDYRFNGKRNTLSLGTYPDTSLALARRKADAAWKLLAEGFDPNQQRKAERQVVAEERIVAERQAQGLPAIGSFEAVAREWFAVRKDGWSKSYGDKVIARLETDVFPYIGRVPAADIIGRSCWKCSDGSRPVGSSRPPTGRCRTQVRSSATPSPPGTPSTTLRGS